MTNVKRGQRLKDHAVDWYLSNAQQDMEIQAVCELC